MRLSIILALALSSTLRALAAPVDDWVRTLTQVSESDISSWNPYTQFARATYCAPSQVEGWNCGEPCDAVPGFQLTLAEGDGGGVQYYYVGYWPANNAVVVAHQGTDPFKFQADLTDANILKTNLDPVLFPGVPSDVLVHEGFAHEHAKTAQIILAEVQNLILKHSATEVILVGHSLGAALAELECLYMTLNLPSDIHVKGQTYGTPRVGNPAYASLFDSKVPDFVRINHARDPVPILSGEFLGFSHVQGEIHIVSESASGVGDVAYECPGDDGATDEECTIRTVPNVFVGNLLDHLGPYPGNLYMGTYYCR
ncbi:alpha beta-hydrolase [Coniophora puteana RWD-64-598 SS2]|uniref:Alpha beta-hydrolase n=1 Tax=Coniophora puteana (strain RWD-64-598) TaxID=741705 RepID=A0A5M3MFY5_CONPW|nr:alpha beta-hydrolase [Coniophora puteana RWD-64-598 SS2]EIW78158.1 alpha beta-hydrolase [Coniophora puteana RWD-64-598 SS2]